MNVKASYLKDVNGNKISPIVSANTIYDSNGQPINLTIENVKSLLDELNGEEV